MDAGQTDPEARVRVETSAWSAVLERRIAGRQRLTRRFLRTVGRRRRLVTSDLALAEIHAHPKPELRKAILKFLYAMRPRVLGPSPAVRRTSNELMRLGGWGDSALADVTQLGYALCGDAEAFVTWNQKDLARDRVREVVRAFCRSVGRTPLEVGTPLEVAEWLDIRIP